VHASGRYYRNTLVEILKNDFGYDKVYSTSTVFSIKKSFQLDQKCLAVNRLDRLTSGLLIIPLTTERARTLTDEFMAGTVRKEYVARCKGEFPV
jgi:23S rRNA-/tRNA-specific pseudouridylate synthase